LLSKKISEIYAAKGSINNTADNSKQGNKLKRLITCAVAQKGQ
jgi:hypothetical protein